MKWKLMVAAGATTAVIMGGSVGPALAETATRVVGYKQVQDGYPAQGSDPKLWYREDTRTGGSVTLANHFGAPPDLGSGSLVLTTNAKNFSKAQLINHESAGTLVSDVQALSYWTFQSNDDTKAPGATGSVNDNASYQLQIDVDGDLSTTADRTNLVYETYWNDTEGTDPQQPLNPGEWQFWDAAGGDWWSNKQIDCGDFHLLAGGGGPPFSRPSEVGASCAGAVVVGIGVNVGSYNPNHIVGVDGVHFQSTTDDLTYNFEPK